MIFTASGLFQDIPPTWGFSEHHWADQLFLCSMKPFSQKASCGRRLRAWANIRIDGIVRRRIVTNVFWWAMTAYRRRMVLYYRCGLACCVRKKGRVDMVSHKDKHTSCIRMSTYARWLSGPLAEGVSSTMKSLSEMGSCIILQPL